ncbi:MAG: hypothetical protein LC777_03355 [Actinobacteria bacterium]|nr:hypothetical protein [Actinomycetota bacterium]
MREQLAARAGDGLRARALRDAAALSVQGLAALLAAEGDELVDVDAGARGERPRIAEPAQRLVWRRLVGGGVDWPQKPARVVRAALGGELQVGDRRPSSA